MLSLHSQTWELYNSVWDDSLTLFHNASPWMSKGWWCVCVCVRRFSTSACKEKYLIVLHTVGSLRHWVMQSVFVYNARKQVYETWLQFDSTLASSRICDLIDLVLVTYSLTQASQTSRGFHALQCQQFSKNSAINKTSVAALWLKAFFMLEVREEWRVSMKARSMKITAQYNRRAHKGIWLHI